MAARRDPLPPPFSPLCTIGYEGGTLPGVLDALGQAGVTLLIDVRAVASSRKPGFSKRLLAASLLERGIGYLHLQGLGTPKAGRQAVRAGHPERMRAIYADHLRSDRAQSELAAAEDAARHAAACLLCFERDHAHCHRDIVATLVAGRTGQPIRHLLAPAAVPEALPAR